MRNKSASGSQTRFSELCPMLFQVESILGQGKLDRRLKAEFFVKFSGTDRADEIVACAYQIFTLNQHNICGDFIRRLIYSLEIC